MKLMSIIIFFLLIFFNLYTQPSQIVEKLTLSSQIYHKDSSVIKIEDLIQNESKFSEIVFNAIFDINYNLIELSELNYYFITYKDSIFHNNNFNLDTNKIKNECKQLRYKIKKIFSFSNCLFYKEENINNYFYKNDSVHIQQFFMYSKENKLFKNHKFKNY